MKRRIKHLIMIAVATLINYIIYKEALRLGLPNELGIGLLVALYIAEQAIVSTLHEEKEHNKNR